MSRTRTRPTREETRARLYAAAAEVFAERGVEAASVEQIVAAAGFTRGAFYSNFASKEDLAVAMLEDHLALSLTHNRALLGEHPDGAGLIEALREDDRADPLHRSPLLQVELMLFLARNPDQRARLGEHLRTMRTLLGEIAAATLPPGAFDGDPADLGLVLVAIEDGLRLHRMIAPDTTPEDAFLDALTTLHALTVDRGRGAPS